MLDLEGFSGFEQLKRHVRDLGRMVHLRATSRFLRKSTAYHVSVADRLHLREKQEEEEERVD